MNKQELIEKLTQNYKEREKNLVAGYTESVKFVESDTKYKAFTAELYKLRMEFEDSLRKIEYSE